MKITIPTAYLPYLETAIQADVPALTMIPGLAIGYSIFAKAINNMIDSALSFLAPAE